MAATRKWIARWEEHGASVEQEIKPEQAERFRTAGVEVTEYVNIGHDHDCNMVVGKPCSCGGIWREASDYAKMRSSAKMRRSGGAAILWPPIFFTRLEVESLRGLVNMITNDEGFDTYGLSPQEKAAIRRALDKLNASAWVL